MATRFAILGSGSSGNSAYLETEKSRILIDAGFSCAQIRNRLAQLGRSPEDLDAVIVTHEHGDHIRGLKVLCSRHGVPLFANRMTHEFIERQFQCSIPCNRFETGHSFDVGDISIESFSVPHDAQDPVGFILRTPGATVGFLTDLGHVTTSIHRRVEDAQVLVLETNYDQRMLEEDMVRPWSVKQRIMSRHGHLSNEDAGALAGRLASRRLEHLFLGHLSRDCNTPQKALNCVTSSLLRETLALPQVYAAAQESPSGWLQLD
jgi:phosphoribosyl 1,2-cyclic phosphodiesterase